MSVDRDQTRKIAALARLHFDESDLTRITGELNHILEHVETLRALEQRGASPLPDPRSSTRGPDADRPDALAGGIEGIAPDWRQGFFVVPPLPGVHAEDGG